MKATRSIFYLMIVAVLFGTSTFPVSFTKAATQDGPKPNPWRTGEILLRLKGNPKIFKIKVDRSEIDSMVRAYKESPLVELAEPNQLFRASLIPDDIYFQRQEYHHKVLSQDAWDRVQGIPQVVIAIIDSGVDINHPDLIQNIWINPDEIGGDGIDNDRNGYIDDTRGWDFVTNTPDPTPKEGSMSSMSLLPEEVRSSAGSVGLNHGTVVAGVAAAKGNNREGIAGVTWNSRIMSVRILDSSGFGDTLNVSKAIDYAINEGASVINLSFVGFDQSTLMDDAIKRAYDKNIVVVAAGGNTSSSTGGTDLDQTPGYPACTGVGTGVNLVIGVAALDLNDKKAGFSNYGAKCIDISAPGTNFFSTQATNQSLLLNEPYGGGWSGTSLATPLISGGAALVKSLAPTLGAKEIMDILINNSDSIDSLNPEYVGKIGKGRLNLFRAVLATMQVQAPPPAPPPPPPAPVQIDLPPPTAPEVNSLITTAAGLLNSEVQIFDFSTRAKVRTFSAYPFVFTGGVNVASADLEGDGTQEIVVAPGIGGSPHVRIFDSRGNVKGQFFAGSQTLRGGATLAIADTNKDGQKEIVVGMGKGSKPLVKIFNKSGTLLREFSVYADTFTGGIRVAAGDLDNDGNVEIVTVPEAGIVGKVAVFDTAGSKKFEFTPFPNFTGGLNVTVGDLSGDNFREIMVAPGSGGGPQVQVYNAAGKLLGQFFAFDSAQRGGAFLASGDADSQLGDEIIAGAGKNTESKVRVFDKRGVQKFEILAYPLTYKGGVRVSVLNEKITQ